MSETSGLNLLDAIVFVVYFAGLISMSWYFGRSQTTQEDYYVGGRDLPWWAVGLSTAATQSSAIGFMSIPAFIALKEGGGLKILQGEFILPLAMIFIMVTLIPFFRKLELVSVYDYLSRRFDPSVKYLISGVFLLSRGIGTAVGLYMTAIVFSTVMEMPLWLTTVLIGGITLVYDAIGGIKAVVYSDVVQMGVLLVGAVVVVGYAIGEVGGLTAFQATLSEHLAPRLTVLDFEHHGFGDGGDFAFWPQFFGGFFLLASYYGCDQTQTQRELSASSLDETRKSLVFNGFFRFPLSLLYAGIGLALGAYVATHPEFVGRVEALGKVDYVLPLFIMEQIPHGLKALIFVAVLAAAMSSLDSSINSLSAATLTDFVNPLLLKGQPSERQFLLLSKATTVIWGALVTVLAFYVGDISSTVIESIGIVGSAFYGPILAAFVAGVGIPIIGSRAIFVGILAGVTFNGVLHFYFSEIFWMWWNLIGCGVTVGVALVWALIDRGNGPGEKQSTYLIWNTDLLSGERAWIRTYAMLVVYCGVMIGICWAIPSLLGV